MLTTLSAGFCLYAIAFFLPAVGSMRGWECAWIVSAVALHWPESAGQLVYPVIALLNPLVLFYLVTTLARRLQSRRGILIIAILICVVATASLVLFQQSSSDTKIHIGYVMWTAGILLMIAPELRFIVTRRMDL
jgi:hypothetical protein